MDNYNRLFDEYLSVRTVALNLGISIECKVNWKTSIDEIQYEIDLIKKKIDESFIQYTGENDENEDYSHYDLDDLFDGRDLDRLISMPDAYKYCTYQGKNKFLSNLPKTEIEDEFKRLLYLAIKYDIDVTDIIDTDNIDNIINKLSKDKLLLYNIKLIIRIEPKVDPYETYTFNINDCIYKKIVNDYIYMYEALRRIGIKVGPFLPKTSDLSEYCKANQIMHYYAKQNNIKVPTLLN